MSIAQQSLALSAGREDEGKKKIAYKTKIHSIRGEWRKIQTMGWNKNKQEQNAMFHKKKWTFELTFNAIVMIVIYIVFFSRNVCKGGRGTVRRWVVGKTMSVMLRLTVSHCHSNVHTEYSGNAVPMFARGPGRPRGSERSGHVTPLRFINSLVRLFVHDPVSAS